MVEKVEKIIFCNCKEEERDKVLTEIVDCLKRDTLSNGYNRLKSVTNYLLRLKVRFLVLTE